MTLTKKIDLAITSYRKSMAAIRLFCKTNEKAFADSSLTVGQIREKLNNPPREDTEGTDELGPDMIKLSLTEGELDLLREVMEDQSHLLLHAEGMVNVMAAIYAIALFDGLLVDLYRLCLTFVPLSLASKELTISVEQVMKAGDIESLQLQLITEEVERFAFCSVLEQFKKFQSRLGVAVADLKVVDSLEPIRARRNILFTTEEL